jgi:hypothetical protein
MENITLRIKYQAGSSIGRLGICQQSKNCRNAVLSLQGANPSPQDQQVREVFWKGLDPVTQVSYLVQHRNLIGRYTPRSYSYVFVM